MKLFTIGPVQMYERTLKQKAEQVPYFRNSSFSEMMLETDALLKWALDTDSSTHCMYLTASGTAAMEAAVINVFNKDDKLLVVAGGTFGKRFSHICEIHGISHTDIALGQGAQLTENILAEYDGKGYTGFLVNLDETSTGQLYDINIISAFCRRNGCILVVDAITSFLCDEYSMDKFGADVTIMSSQKGLCVSPGVSVVAVNDKTFTKRVMQNSPATLYFDFKDYDRNILRGQTPFTPAVGIMYEIHDFLLYLKEKGIDRHLAEIDERARYFRNRLSEIGGRTPDYPMSNAITPVIFDRPIARTLYLELAEKYGMVVNPTGGSMEEYQIRVSHIGDLSLGDYDELIEAMKEIIAELN